MTAITLRQLGQRDYHTTWQAMQDFTATRDEDTRDEIWCVEHPPVFTLGQAGKQEHVLDAGDIPVIQIDRGGQVTYHGPGQAVVYLLIDIRRRNLGIRYLVSTIEKALIALLTEYGIQATARPKAPGVYVSEKKIAAIGLRIRRGCSYHGLSLNVDMDLEPFQYINPCGYPGLEVTQMADLGISANINTISQDLLRHLTTALGYDTIAHSEIPAP